MRLVAVADTHTFEEDLGILPAGDVMIHAGDLCRGGTLDELAGVAAWIQAQPHTHKIVVAGNHDGCFQQERSRAEAVLGPEVIYLQDSLVVIDGVRFWGSPWQPAFNDWAFNLHRGAALAEKWALIPSDIDVLITHSPPAGFGDNLGESGPPGREGCADLLEAVRRVRPALHLFGHIHQDGGLWKDGDSVLVNVTSWECERGATVIDFDIDTQVVTPVRVPERV